MLVTSPSDTLYQAQVPGQPVEQGVTAPQELDLANSAQIYAYLVAGETINDQVESEVGALDDETESITAIRRTTQPAGDERFPGSLKLPVLEVVGTAATEDRAEETQRRRDRRVPRLRDGRAGREADRAREPRCSSRSSPGTPRSRADSSNPAIPIVITGVAVFLAFVALALILGGIRSSREKKRNRGTRRRSRDTDLPPAEAEATDSDAAASDASPDREDDAEHVLIGAGTGTRAD